MNPTTEQQLDAIVVQCKANLALAEKRTQGRWTPHQSGRSYKVQPAEIWLGDCSALPESATRDNAAYIATCAGAAESGWRSTIAAIEGLQKIAWVEASGNRDYSWTGEQAFAALTAIVSAWEANK